MNNIYIMKTIEKNIIYFFTLIIDIILIYILLYKNINTFDYSYILGILLVHIIFYISIYQQNRQLIDFCHWALMICLGLSVLISNKYLLILPTILLITVPLFWEIFGKCILNTDDQNESTYFYDTFGISLTHAVFILIIITSLKFLNIIK
jgi:hypothetical protein|tara:strand:+ start:2379 stop:2828 length:450 start_codon:yes stop_codon:yes gene_type:complete